MNDLDNNAIDRLLAEKVMGWPFIDDDEPFALHAHKGGVITSLGPGVIRTGIIPQRWSPTTNRNDLSEVLRKLTDQQWSDAVLHIINDKSIPVISILSFLTCDPSIIARAVAEVVRGAQTPGEGGAQ